MVSRILEALLPDVDNADDHDDVDSLETASIIISSNGRPPSALSGTRVPNYEIYRTRLAPLIELEDRLTRLLSAPEEEEPTHLPSFHVWEHNGHLTAPGPSAPYTNGNGRGRPAPTILIPQQSHSRVSPVSPVNGNRNGSTIPTSSSSPNGSSSKSRGKEVSVHTSINWKKTFTLGGNSKSPKTPESGEVAGWWEDPEDPVHALNALAPVMTELWRDPKVRQRLREKRLRLEESSGLYVDLPKCFLWTGAYFHPLHSYLDDISRITAKKYIPTDGSSTLTLVINSRRLTFVRRSGRSQGTTQNYRRC